MPGIGIAPGIGPIPAIGAVWGPASGVVPGAGIPMGLPCGATVAGKADCAPGWTVVGFRTTVLRRELNRIATRCPAQGTYKDRGNVESFHR